MIRELKPNWSAEQQAEGDQFRQAWEEFFSSTEAAPKNSGQACLDSAETANIAAIQAQHEAELLGYPNVVGVAEGIRMKQGVPTGEPCLVVYVEQKLPHAKLGKDEILPSQIDGVPVDVVEAGQIEPLPV